MSIQRYYSNIYWHFTGSPKPIDWREVRCPADINKQNAVVDAENAAKTLKKILQSHKLLATCTERVLDDLDTAKFCCVTDIPLKDLPSHAAYYGKVAIGFKAKAVHKYFLPVIYLPKSRMPFIEMMVPNRQLTKWPTTCFNIKAPSKSSRPKECFRRQLTPPSAFNHQTPKR